MPIDDDVIDAGTNDTPDTPDTPNDASAGDQNADAGPTSTADAVARALAGDDDADGRAMQDTDGPDAPDQPETPEDDPENPNAKPEGEDADLKAPDGLSKSAKERFETLAGRVRTAMQERDQVARERDEVKTRYDTVVKVMEDTGAAPDQFAAALVMLGHANSGDPARLGQALDMLDEVRAEWARKAGRVVPGVDVLSDFPDLKEQVLGGRMTEEAAAEVAAARRDRASRQQADDKRRQEADAQGQLQQRIQTAQAGLTELGNSLKAKDPDFAHKLDILGKRGFFERVAQTAPPEQWGELFHVAYDALGDVAAAARPTAPPANQQPMRRTPEGGGGTPRPKTTADAVRLALAEED